MCGHSNQSPVKKHELVQLAGKIDWDWLDGEMAPNVSRPHLKRGTLLARPIMTLIDARNAARVLRRLQAGQRDAANRRNCSDADRRAPLV
jgi:hypothetical protein